MGVFDVVSHKSNHRYALIRNWSISLKHLQIAVNHENISLDEILDDPDFQELKETKEFNEWLSNHLQ